MREEDEAKEAKGYVRARRMQVMASLGEGNEKKRKNEKALRRKSLAGSSFFFLLLFLLLPLPPLWTRKGG